MRADQRTKATLALVLALGCTAEPSSAVVRTERATQQPGSTRVVRVAPSDGFDWGDAAIGAAGGLGLSMLVVGGGLVLGGTRHNNPQEER